MEKRQLGVSKPHGYLLVHLIFGAVCEEETDLTPQVFADLKDRSRLWGLGSAQGLISGLILYNYKISKPELNLIPLS